MNSILEIYESDSEDETIFVKIPYVKTDLSKYVFDTIQGGTLVLNITKKEEQEIQEINDTLDAFGGNTEVNKTININDYLTVPKEIFEGKSFEFSDDFISKILSIFEIISVKNRFTFLKYMLFDCLLPKELFIKTTIIPKKTFDDLKNNITKLNLVSEVDNSEDLTGVLIKFLEKVYAKINIIRNNKSISISDCIKNINSILSLLIREKIGLLENISNFQSVNSNLIKYNNSLIDTFNTFYNKSIQTTQQQSKPATKKQVKINDDEYDDQYDNQYDNYYK